MTQEEYNVLNKWYSGYRGVKFKTDAPRKRIAEYMNANPTASFEEIADLAVKSGYNKSATMYEYARMRFNPKERQKYAKPGAEPTTKAGRIGEQVYNKKSMRDYEKSADPEAWAKKQPDVKQSTKDMSKKWTKEGIRSSNEALAQNALVGMGHAITGIVNYRPLKVGKGVPEDLLTQNIAELGTSGLALLAAPEGMALRAAQATKIQPAIKAATAIKKFADAGKTGEKLAKAIAINAAENVALNKPGQLIQLAKGEMTPEQAMREDLYAAALGGGIRGIAGLKGIKGRIKADKVKAAEIQSANLRQISRILGAPVKDADIPLFKKLGYLDNTLTKEQITELQRFARDVKKTAHKVKQQPALPAPKQTEPPFIPEVKQQQEQMVALPAQAGNEKYLAGEIGKRAVEVADPVTYRYGDTVSHPEYGTGIIRRSAKDKQPRIAVRKGKTTNYYDLDDNWSVVKTDEAKPVVERNTPKPVEPVAREPVVDTPIVPEVAPVKAKEPWEMTVSERNAEIDILDKRINDADPTLVESDLERYDALHEANRFKPGSKSNKLDQDIAEQAEIAKVKEQVRQEFGDIIGSVTTKHTGVTSRATGKPVQTADLQSILNALEPNNLDHTALINQLSDIIQRSGKSHAGYVMKSGKKRGFGELISDEITFDELNALKKHYGFKTETTPTQTVIPVRPHWPNNTVAFKAKSGGDLELTIEGIKQPDIVNTQQTMFPDVTSKPSIDLSSQSGFVRIPKKNPLTLEEAVNSVYRHADEQTFTNEVPEYIPEPIAQPVSEPAINHGIPNTPVSEQKPDIGQSQTLNQDVAATTTTTTEGQRYVYEHSPEAYAGGARAFQNEIREAAGVELLERIKHSTFQELATASQNAVDGGLIDPKGLVRKVNEDLYHLDDLEWNAVLYDQIKLRKAHEALFEQYKAAMDAGDMVTADKIHEQYETAFDAYLQNQKALNISGSEAGQRLNIIKAMYKEDYTLDRLVKKAIGAKKNVTPELYEQLRKGSEEVAAINKQEDDYVAKKTAAKDVVRKLVNENGGDVDETLKKLIKPDSPAYGSLNTRVTKEEYEQICKEIASRFSSLNMGVDPTVIAPIVKYIEYHAEAIYHYSAMKLNYSNIRSMINRDFGDKIDDEYIKQAWEQYKGTETAIYDDADVKIVKQAIAEVKAERGVNVKKRTRGERVADAKNKETEKGISIGKENLSKEEAKLGRMKQEKVSDPVIRRQEAAIRILKRNIQKAEELLDKGQPRPKKEPLPVNDTIINLRERSKELNGQLKELEDKLNGADAKQVKALIRAKERARLQLDKVNIAIESKQRIPTREIGYVPDNELLNLRTERRLKMAILDMLTRGDEKLDFWDKFAEAMNLTRAFKASCDAGHIFRNGGMLIGETKEWLAASKSSLGLLFSEKNLPMIQEMRRNHPMYAFAVRMGVFEDLLDLPMPEHMIGENRIGARYAERIPVAGKVIRASNRSYSEFGNMMRFSVFFKYVSALGDTATEYDYQQIAKFVNRATGRGTMNIGPLKLETAAPALSALQFAPRWWISRLQAPLYVMSKSKVTRKIAAKNLAAYIGLQGVTHSLAYLMGGAAAYNLLDSQFGRAQIDDTRIDASGGLFGSMSKIAQWLAGQRFNSDTKRYEKVQPSRVFMNFLRSKLAPAPGFVWNVKEGSNISGDPYTLDNWFGVLWNEVSPMIAQDIASAFKEYGWDNLLSILAVAGMGGAMFTGIGMNTYDEEKQEREKKRRKAQQERRRRSELWK